jgi:acetylornithine deacetylase
MEELEHVLEVHKQEYLQNLINVAALDTQDLGQGIDGGREKAGQEYMIDLFKSMHADEIKKDPMNEDAIKRTYTTYKEGNLGHNQQDRYNVYAKFKGAGGKSLLFNGHIDVMPPGDEKVWKYPPFKPTVEGNRLYGRGTADMKGGLVAASMAVQLLSDAKIRLPGDVIITSVCDEEGGGNGSMQAIDSGVKADGVVVCEGTSDELILAHMGFVFLRVTVEGKANHSGAKWLGVSALDKVRKIMAELDELEHRWLLTYKHPLLPAPNLNVGTIHGGTAASTVPGFCTIEMCIHYLPHCMSHDQIVQEVTDAVKRVAQSDLWLRDHLPVVTEFQAGGAFEMEDSPFVESFCKAYKKARGRDVKKVGSPAGCDSRLWKNIANCPTIQFGPGNLEQCHAVNEYLELDAFYQAVLVYAELILEWCKK